MKRAEPIDIFCFTADELLPLWKDYSLEEFGCYLKIKWAYMRSNGRIPVNRIHIACGTNNREERVMIDAFANRIMQKEGEYYVNEEWDKERRRYNGSIVKLLRKM